MTDDLSPGERRVLTGYLRHIKCELALVERVLTSPYDGILIPFVEDIDETTRARLDRGMQQARALIREARERFALEPEQVPATRWVSAHFGVESVTAEQCGSRRLAGYGRVPPSLAAQLDPLARRLSALQQAMQRLVVAAPAIEGWRAG